VNGTSFPDRVCSLERARALHGDRVDRVAAFLSRCDPLADACVEAFAALPARKGFALLDRALRDGIGAVPDAPAPLRALFAAIDDVPAWVDWSVVDRGGELLVRSGPFGAMVLGFRSLLLAYAAPAGNKPLVLSGRLTEQAARRLAETGRFVHGVCRAGAMRRDAEGFAMTVKVRLMHAQVRRLARRSGKWRSERWGEPINQHDMVGTILVFSLALVDGLRALGFRASDDEVDAYVQLWRYVGHVIGVHPDLLFASEREGRSLGAVMGSFQGAPDDDARALVAALFGRRTREPMHGARALAVRGHRRFLMGLARGLVGGEMADALDLPDDVFRHAVHVLRPAIGFGERLRERSAIARRWAVAAGDARWARVVRVGLGDEIPDYRPPDALAGER
jgi:hypothetical protein